MSDLMDDIEGAQLDGFGEPAPAADYVDHEQAAGPADPDAPYGRRPDGKPYTKSPEERAAIGARLAAARAAAPAAGGTRRRRAAPKPPGKTSPRSTSPAPAEADFRATCHMLLVQLPQFALGMLGRFNPIYEYDAAAVVVHGPPLADAVASTAQNYEPLRNLLERAAPAGPLAVVGAAAIPLVLQILANHRIIAPAPEIGVFSTEELHAELVRRAGAQAA